MRKISILLMVILLASLLFAGCGGGSVSGGSEAVSSAAPSENPAAPESPGASASEPASGASAEASADNNASIQKLVMATEAGFKPYEYYENGSEIVGVDVDIAREIAAELGVELVVENMEFNAIVPAVNSGKAHFGAAGISITEERRKQVDFSIEYATSKQVILTRKDSGIETGEDLDGKNVGVQLGTVADYALTDDYPEVSVSQYNKYFEAANDLIGGRLDAIVLDSLPAMELAQMDDSLVIREKELFTDVYAICVKKGNTELLETINKVLQRLIDEGKIIEFTSAHSAE